MQRKVRLQQTENKIHANIVAVIGKQHRGTFKRVFDSAQKDLRAKFGMEMVQLTSREKVTMKEKRGTDSIVCMPYLPY